MISQMLQRLNEFDPEIASAVEAEFNRQRNGIELIASENFVSEPVLLAAGTILLKDMASGEQQLLGTDAAIAVIRKKIEEKNSAPLILEER